MPERRGLTEKDTEVRLVSLEPDAQGLLPGIDRETGEEVLVLPWPKAKRKTCNASVHPERRGQRRA